MKDLLKTCCGSPAYAAPELLRGGGYYGPTVDVWSAGVLLYALLVGRLPFDDQNLPNLYRKIQSGLFHIPQTLSIESQDLIRSMLQTDPNKRITTDKILSHTWLKGIKEADDISTDNHMSFDVLDVCRELFPDVCMRELEQNISYGFGYQTANYWLIRINPNIIETLIAKPIESKLPSLHNSTTGTYSPKTPLRRRSKSCSNASKKSSDNSPKVIGFKRKIQFETLKQYQVNNSIMRSPVPTKLVIREELVDTPTKIPVLKASEKLSPNVQNVIKIQKPTNPTTTPIAPKSTQTPNTPTPSRNARALIPLSLSNKNKSFSTKTPLMATNEAKNLPKKSIIKRLLETATPSKSQTPRQLIPSTNPKNISLTNFTDPQQLIDKLMETLKHRGLQCRQKCFSLRCVLSSMNVIDLSFNLEIYKYEDKCVIQRKRLKGSSWDYKRICEDILKISNQLSDINVSKTQ